MATPAQAPSAPAEQPALSAARSWTGPGSAPARAGPLGLVARYPGAAIAVIAALVALLVFVRSRPPAAPAAPRGDPETEGLIAKINAWANRPAGISADGLPPAAR